MIRRSILDSSIIYYFNIISRRLIYKLFLTSFISFIIISYLARLINRYTSLKKIFLLIYLILITFKLKDLLLYRESKKSILTIFYLNLYKILSILITGSIRPTSSNNPSNLVYSRYNKYYRRY